MTNKQEKKKKKVLHVYLNPKGAWFLLTGMNTISLGHKIPGCDWWPRALLQINPARY